jgi:hypothetical protein
MLWELDKCRATQNATKGDKIVSSKPLKLIVIVTLSLCLLFVLTVAMNVMPTATLAAESSPSPTPTVTTTASPTPTPEPRASLKLVRKARKLQKHALFHAWCLGKRGHTPQLSRPIRRDITKTEAKGKIRFLRTRISKSWKQISRPNGYPYHNSAKQWRPLVRHEWPAHLVEKAVIAIHTESRGQPWVNLGGLFQHSPWPSWGKNPVLNVRYAYTKKFLPAKACWGNGWHPWAWAVQLGWKD